MKNFKLSINTNDKGGFNIIYFFSFTIAYIVVINLMPFSKKIAAKLDFVDKPNERKIHKDPIPLSGGIGVFLGFITTFILFSYKFNFKSISIIIGPLLMLSIGIFDDWYKKRGKDFFVFPKLIVQIIAAIIVYKVEILFYGFYNPFTQQDVALPVFLQLMFSIIWIFGVTTVINFVDGMDGLVGRLTSISVSALFVVSLAKRQADSAIIAVILVGVMLGFLQYNKHPVKMFLGDSGATFLGYILGIIALDGAFKHVTEIIIFVPILALGVPIFDNLFVIKRFLEDKPIYQVI